MIKIQDDKNALIFKSLLN